MITQAGIQRILDLLDADLTHIALDAGTPTEVGLQDEHFRQALTAPLRDGSISIYEVYLDETQGNGHTGGIALIAQGTDTPGTGQLFSIDPVNIDKTNLQSLTISIEVSVEVG